MESINSVIFRLENVIDLDGSIVSQLQLDDHFVRFKHPVSAKTIAYGLETLANFFTGAQDNYHNLMMEYGEHLLESK